MPDENDRMLWLAIGSVAASFDWGVINGKMESVIGVVSQPIDVARELARERGLTSIVGALGAALEEAATANIRGANNNTASAFTLRARQLKQIAYEVHEQSNAATESANFGGSSNRTKEQKVAEALALIFQHKSRWSGEDYAKAVGVSRSTLYKWPEVKAALKHVNLPDAPMRGDTIDDDPADNIEE